MFNQSIDRLNTGIDGLKSFIFINNEMRNLLGATQERFEPSYLEQTLSDLKKAGPSVAQWRIMDHCSVVGRLYALYEQFYESILSEWIEFCSTGKVYASLPENVRSSYQEGFLYISSIITKSRYEHLSFPDLITQYNLALSGEINYRLTPELLTYHKNNLRWPDLCELCTKCGIDNLQQWISQSTVIAQHFQTDRKLHELTSSKLKNFIDYRNDAAHGSVAVDQILGPQDLIDFVSFIKSVCEAIYQLLNHRSIQMLIDDGKANNIGIVTETFSSNIVVALVEGIKLRKGDQVRIVTDRSYHVRSIINLKVDDNDTQEIFVANAKEIGIKFDAPVPKRSKIVTLAIQ